MHAYYKELTHVLKDFKLSNLAHNDELHVHLSWT